MRRQTPFRKVTSQQCRRGSATVEFAVVAPLFIALLLGLMQNSYNVDVSHRMHAVVRQAGRLASQDFRSKLQQGQTGNQKVIQDIKNQLTAEGLPGNKATVTITHAEGAGAGSTFDLANPANDLKLFRLKVEIPYKELGAQAVFPNATDKVSASLVFRKGKNTLVSQ
jgi:Flp pilus assembly protein TadG